MKLIKKIITILIIWFLIQFLFFGGLAICEKAERRINGTEISKITITENNDTIEFYVLEKKIFSVRNIFSDF